MSIFSYHLFQPAAPPVAQFAAALFPIIPIAFPKSTVHPLVFAFL
ncbi:hypothetical protein FM115_06940 [Marinilactibacillus psychrotolerans 42ea]|uniref:Uncharacterized protein n=1 Tax=Marinilactibacillus psychrotolerans 42ea TaxID=1255609 RepID=A0A1R4JV02_9LACT|nr:hypothetical protein FM115_06940 [Marinilactibacillus psychrotolerans 42ea]